MDLLLGMDRLWEMNVHRETAFEDGVVMTGENTVLAGKSFWEAEGGGEICSLG